jgi:hypothetical protein
MVTVDALLLTVVAVGVMPVGADVAVVPAALVYHMKLPVVPVGILAVVTANVALAAVPVAIVPV